MSPLAIDVGGWASVLLAVGVALGVFAVAAFFLLHVLEFVHNAFHDAAERQAREADAIRAAERLRVVNGREKVKP
jgi:hypothetical protein